MAEIVDDWTDSADFDEPRKTGDHHHARTDEPIDTPYGVIDYAVGDGPDTDGNAITEPYDLFYMMKSSGPTHWPWDDPPTGESRDPVELGVVAIPAYELHFGTHTYGLFSTVDQASARIGGVPEKQQSTIDNRKHANGYPEPIVGFAHVGRYVGEETITDREYERFRFNVERLARQDVPSVVGTGRNSEYPHVETRLLWDRLLTEFAPAYLPIKIAHNDPRGDEDGVVGDGLDRRWYSTLMSADEYDVDDQAATRVAARETIGRRAVLAHFRDSFDPDGSVPEPPAVEDAGVDGATVYVDSDADEQVWITARGEEVETGTSVDVSEGERYLRCELWNDDESALTLTQAWGIRSE
jgi:hypothetical protein